MQRKSTGGRWDVSARETALTLSLVYQPGRVLVSRKIWFERRHSRDARVVGHNVNGYVSRPVFERRRSDVENVDRRCCDWCWPAVVAVAASSRKGVDERGRVPDPQLERPSATLTSSHLVYAIGCWGSGVAVPRREEALCNLRATNREVASAYLS